MSFNSFNSRNSKYQSNNLYNHNSNRNIFYNKGETQRQRSRQKSTRYNSNRFNNNASNKYSNNCQYENSVKTTRQIFEIDIGNPKVFLVWKYPKQKIQDIVQSNKNNKIVFTPQLQISQKPPLKIQPQNSRLSELKNDITPVEQIWSSMIKQYLNDSQFVQIYRKRNSLNYDQIQYGKTIIKYDGLWNNQKKYYNNDQTQYNIFSRAYFKLWQILSLGILQKKKQEQINIANLAQGPGGFIHSIIDFRLKQNKTLQDKYYAITLKIQEGKTRNAKDWSDTRAIKFVDTLKKDGYKIILSYGQKNDGNLLEVQNSDSFKTHIMQGQQAFFITGDGGIQCIGDDQFHYQQIFNAKLFFAQILTALKIQQIGGTFVLKIYDIHFQITKQLIILLCLFYRKVGIIKPLTSRPGNSQKYVLCEQFKGLTKQQIIKLDDILKQWTKIQSQLSYFKNKQFLQSIIKFSSQNSVYPQFQKTIRDRIKFINEQLVQEQQKKIEEGLNIIKKHNGNKLSMKKQIYQERFKYQMSYAYQWCKKYGLKTIDVKIIKNKQQKQVKKINY